MTPRSKAILSVAVPGLVACVLVTGCYSQQALPRNELTCSAIKPGWVAFYLDGKQEAPGMFHVRSGRVCSWTFNSETLGGQTWQWTNPPVTVTAWDGRNLSFPGDSQYLYSPVKIQLTD